MLNLSLETIKLYTEDMQVYSSLFVWIKVTMNFQY